MSEKPPFCYRCGADKKESIQDRAMDTCNHWGTYYGKHMWSNAKRHPEAFNFDKDVKTSIQQEERQKIKALLMQTNTKDLTEVINNL